MFITGAYNFETFADNAVMNYWFSGLYRLNNNETKLEKNKTLGDLLYIWKEFSVSVEFFLDNYPAADVPFVNVLHLTRKDDGPELGNRIPGVWIRPSKELHESFSISGNWNSVANHAVESGKWNKVEINQKLVDGKVVILISFDTYSFIHYF